MNSRITKLRNSSIFGILTGTGFFCIGVWEFLSNNPGTFAEKYGTVMMALGGILLGVGFSVYIIWKIK